MKKYIALIVLFLTMLPAFASAQKTINIQGVVTDSNNETQIGVNIYPRNDQSHGTVTDIDGKYTIQVNLAQRSFFLISDSKHKRSKSARPRNKQSMWYWMPMRSNWKKSVS